jgi:hypothetical protein
MILPFHQRQRNERLDQGMPLSSFEDYTKEKQRDKERDREREREREREKGKGDRQRDEHKKDRRDRGEGGSHADSRGEESRRSRRDGDRRDGDRRSPSPDSRREHRSRGGGEEARRGEDRHKRQREDDEIADLLSSDKESKRPEKEKREKRRSRSPKKVRASGFGDITDDFLLKPPPPLVAAPTTPLEPPASKLVDHPDVAPSGEPKADKKAKAEEEKGEKAAVPKPAVNLTLLAAMHTVLPALNEATKAAASSTNSTSGTITYPGPSSILEMIRDCPHFTAPSWTWDELADIHRKAQASKAFGNEVSDVVVWTTFLAASEWAPPGPTCPFGLTAEDLRLGRENRH